jgi:hypothetical protein
MEVQSECAVMLRSTLACWINDKFSVNPQAFVKDYMGTWESSTGDVLAVR